MMNKRDSLGFEGAARVTHPGRASLPVGHPTGPAVGDRLPDFSLPDQNGRMLRFHEDRGDAKAVLVFYRSAIW